MNIVFLSELFYPHGRGAEFATYSHAKLLSEAGFNIVVITNKFAGELNISKIGKLLVYRLPFFESIESTKYLILRRFDVLFSDFIAKIIKWGDIVYIPRMWYSAIPVAKAYGKPVIVHFHDYFPLCPLGTLYDCSKDKIYNSCYYCRPSCIIAWERAKSKNLLEILGSSLLNLTIWRFISGLIKLSDAVICVSKAQRDIIVANMPSLTRKSHVIYNPVPELKRIKIDGKDFGYFGGPSPEKGYNVIYSALKYVKSGVTIHATGFTSPKQGANESFLNSKILTYKRLPEDLYKEIYRKIYTVLVPSMWVEPWGYVATEAILKGRLLIASEIGGIIEQVEGCPGTFLFKPGDYRRLAELMEYVNGLGYQTIQDLSAKNREVFLQRFNNERIVRNFSELLTGMV